MTAISSNLLIKAKVEVDEIKSYQQLLPVNINSPFIAGETVVGTNSGATAECVEAIGLGAGFMILAQRDGEFDFNEPITGHSSGLGETTGSRTSGDQDYNNDSLGIVNGLWTIESTGNLGISFDDSVKKINISNGGNYGTGYSFGFTLKNFDLVKQIIEDGVFLQNLPVRYFIDFGDGGGYEQVWGGILDTFPKSGSSTADFKCIDSMKKLSNKIGSEKNPICLNRNYNCKLPFIRDEVLTFDFSPNTVYRYPAKINAEGSLTEAKIIDVEEERNSIVFTIYPGSDWRTELENREGLRLVAVSGGGIDEYSILGFKIGYTDIVGFTYYTFTLDKPLNGIIDLEGAVDGDLTMFKLVAYSKSFAISTEAVESVHTEDGTFTKGLKIIDGEDEYPLYTPLNYQYTPVFIAVTGIGEDGDINSYRSIPIDGTNKIEVQQPAPGSFQVDAIFKIPIDDLKEISKNGDDDSFLIVNDINLLGVISSGSANSPIVKTDSYEIRGYYKSSIITTSPQYYAKILPPTFRAVTYDVTDNGSDIFISPKMSGRELLINGFKDWEPFANVELLVRLRIEYNGAFFQQGTVFFNDFDLRSYKDYDVSDLSIGTNGENVPLGAQFDTYPETIKYIDLNYNGIDISQINTASYDQAQEDYELFNSTVDRNPAHQITSQTDFNDLLGKMLYFSHLGLFPDRFDKRTLVNWLPKSTVFSDSEPTTKYTKFLSIGSIERSRNTKIVSDFELKFNLNEAKDKYEKTMRIKNSNEDSFDFARDTEGIPESLESKASEAWDQFWSGEKRIKKQSKTVVESEWIKTQFPDGTGVDEALTFIRNQSAHINREFEYISFSVPLNKDDAIKELLSFDSVQHPFKTDGQERPGWIVEHKVSFKSGRVHFKFLLDVNKKDPFLKQFNIIQDDDSVDDIIEDDDTELNIIEDGVGY